MRSADNENAELAERTFFTNLTGDKSPYLHERLTSPPYLTRDNEWQVTAAFILHTHRIRVVCACERAALIDSGLFPSSKYVSAKASSSELALQKKKFWQGTIDKRFFTWFLAQYLSCYEHTLNNTSFHPRCKYATEDSLTLHSKTNTVNCIYLS